MAADYKTIEQKIDEIEGELKGIGYWQEEPLPAEAYNITKPFGMDTMTGEQWLQFILVPRVRSMLSGEGEFPQGSSIASWARKEFSGSVEADNLVTMLYQFDRLFDYPGGRV